MAVHKTGLLYWRHLSLTSCQKQLTPVCQLPISDNNNNNNNNNTYFRDVTETSFLSRRCSVLALRFNAVFCTTVCLSFTAPIIVLIFVFSCNFWPPLSVVSFNGQFPGGPGLAGTRVSPFWILLELKMMEVVSGDSWSYKPCLARAKSSPPTIILKLVWHCGSYLLRVK